MNTKKLLSRADRILSLLIGEGSFNGINCQNLSLEQINQLSDARKNLRSFFIVKNFDLGLNSPNQNFNFIVRDGMYLLISGIITDHDGGDLIESPSIQIEYPDSGLSNLVAASIDNESILNGRSISSQAHAKKFEEPFDYMKILEPNSIVSIMAKRSPTDIIGNRKFTVLLTAWEIAKGWQ